MKHANTPTNLNSWLYSLFDKDPAPLSHFLVWRLQSYGLGNNPCVLDVGCGPGRMLSEYAWMGWPAVGIEPDAEFYAQAQQLAATLTNIEVRAAGFEDIEDVERFDCIVAANGAFAYLLTHDIRTTSLERSFRALKPGGLLLIDIPNLLFFLQQNKEPPIQWRQWEELSISLIQQYQYDLHEATFTQVNRYTIENAEGDLKEICKEHHHAIVTFPEIARLLQKSGFCDICTYSSFEARGCERLSGERIVVSARRPL